VAAGLARLIEETGWDVSVQLDKESPPGEFAVYLDEEQIFSRYLAGRMPDPQDIIPVLHTRLFGAHQTDEDTSAGAV